MTTPPSPAPSGPSLSDPVPPHIRAALAAASAEPAPRRRGHRAAPAAAAAILAAAAMWLLGFIPGLPPG